MTRDERWKPIATAALSATALAAFGAMTTDIGSWYFSLRKPSWQPPDWLFGPAWTLIFALAALAGLIHWRSVASRDRRLQVLAAFAANAFLNTLWSLLFFRLKRPDWAFDEVGLLWLSIAVLIVLVARDSRRAAWLLAPYLVWVSFASCLNWTIVHMNGGFGAGG
jgi:tryptophan-rich sensory protein